MFFNVGGYEVLVIAIVALIVVGPEQLPVVMRKIGRYAAQLRHMATGLRQEFMDGLEGTELEDLAKLKDLTRLDTWADLGDPGRQGRGTDDDPIVPRGFAQTQAALEAESVARATAAGGSEADATAAAETVAAEAIAADPSLADPTAPEPPAPGSLAPEPLVVEHPAVEPTVVEPAVVEPTAVEHPAVEPTVVEHPAVEPAVESADGASAREQPAP